MLEKLGKPGYETISHPDAKTLECLDIVMKKNPTPVFYEVGVGIGATTLPVAQKLNNKGEILIFSRMNDVQELAKDLKDRGFTNIKEWGSPYNTFSGYHFDLAMGMHEGKLPKFDVAYLDGGHIFHLDAPAACVLKELCKPGGFIVFDDYSWSYARSPGLNPKKRSATSVEFEPRQIETCHIQLVCSIVMDTDTRFKCIGIYDQATAVYQKISESR
ncbi:MAG: class I SAM-dependent methyltransferase [Deltaproteobacteria bacterium]|nr:class I SAM-dependent methyltransferase [Deltaproteobacteria bacterium]